MPGFTGDFAKALGVLTKPSVDLAMKVDGSLDCWSIAFQSDNEVTEASNSYADPFLLLERIAGMLSKEAGEEKFKGNATVL